MVRYLIAAAAGLSVAACMYPPPGYWGGYNAPYSRNYYPPARYAPPPAAPQIAPPQYAPPPAAPSQDPAPRLSTNDPPRPPEDLDDPSPAPSPYDDDVPRPRVRRSHGDRPSDAGTGYAEEAADYGVPPTNRLRLHDFDAPTPTEIDGARTITTDELRQMLGAGRPPLLVDVIGGQQSVSLPNAVWLRDAGVGRHLDDDVQAWFDYHLARLTNRDKSWPLVIFCASRLCWLAHNATLRALDLGYTNVYWYRGGRDAWQAAGLPMVPVAPPPG